MRQLVLVAVLAAVAASAITALLLPRAAAPSLPAHAQDPGLQEAIESLEREVAALRREMAVREGEPEGGASRGASPPAGDGSPRPEDPGRAADAPAPAEGVLHPRAARPPLEAARKERVAEVLREWKTPEGRRRWLLATDRELLAELGAPDVIQGDADKEDWVYNGISWEDPGGGETRSGTVTFRFNRGRLVQVYP